MMKGVIGDFFSVKGGKRLPKGSRFTNEITDNPYLRVTDFGRNTIDETKLKYISNEIQKTISRYVINDSDVYISIAGTIGISGIIPEHLNGANLTENAAKIAPLDGISIYPKYLSYYLNSYAIQKIIESKTMAVGVPKLALFRIKEIPIYLPPLDQQKKIAAILDAADAYRQKTKALIKKYEELTQSLFLDMFGDETGSLTELGEIIKTVGGGTPSKDNEQYWNGNIPWASVKDLKSDRLNKTQDFITQAGVDNSATRVIPNGSLIVATRMAVGRAAICDMDVAINQDLKAIQLIGEINITYLLYLFKSKENYFDSVSSGATVKGIKVEHITKLKVNLPEIDLQNQFAERVKAIEAQKVQAQAGLAQAEDLFNSLLQRAFKGELTN